jgi:hypothetical protein
MQVGPLVGDLNRALLRVPEPHFDDAFRGVEAGLLRHPRIRIDERVTEIRQQHLDRSTPTQIARSESVTASAERQLCACQADSPEVQEERRGSPSAVRRRSEVGPRLSDAFEVEASSFQSERVVLQ